MIKEEFRMKKSDVKKKKSSYTQKEGLLNFYDMASLGGRIFYWSMFAILFLVSVVCLLPVIWVALSGFKSTAEMYAVPPTFFPESIDLGKAVDLWKNIHIWKYFKNSIILILGCLAFNIIINGLAGYVLSKIRPAGSKLIERLIFTSMMLSGMSLLPLYMTFVDFPIFHINLIGSYLPIWMMAGASAFNVMLFRNFFNGIPDAYVDAARIDGCNSLRIFMNIILPMSKPIIVVLTILTITGTWNNFMWPYLVIGNTDKEPVAVMLYNLTSNNMLQDDESMLLTMFACIPMIIVYSIFSKRIIGGVNMSGIKG